VKVPLVEADQDRARAALTREARHLQRLRHPAFPRLFTASVETPTPHLVLELIEGRPLSTVIERSPLSVGDTVRLGLQLASALRYLHGTGLAHLDVKPDNIMMRDGRALLIDFGAAQDIGDTAPAGPRGTDGYMSPEQRAGAPIRESMDIWSLGAVLYEALTGRRAADRAERRSLRLRRAPAALRDLIGRMLGDDGDRQPPSMAHVLHELSALEGDPRRGWAPTVARGRLPLTTSRATRDRRPGEGGATRPACPDRVPS
jgi:serine/threonine protein kinase